MPSDAYLDRVCPIPPLPGALPRVLTQRMAQAYGVSERTFRRQVRTGSWRPLLPRVYLTADTLTDTDRLDAALLFAGDRAALSGAAALRASEVRGVAMPDEVLVLVPPANRTRSAGWVRVRRTFRPIEVVQWYGPRRAEVARATADEALRLRRLDDVRALVATVVQQGLCTIDQLGRELAEGPRNGSAHLRRALTEVGWGAESAPEARAARILRRAGITGFEQNVWLQLPDGRWRRVDFYWPRLRAALEIDGQQWHFRSTTWAQSLDRDLDLGRIGVAVLHRPPSALADAGRFAVDVRAWLAGREADLRRGLA